MKHNKNKKEIRKKSIDGMGREPQQSHDIVLRKNTALRVRDMMAYEESAQEIVGLVKKKKDTDAITWQAPEYEFHHKDISWYWMSFGIGGVLVLLALWQQNFLFAIFVVIAWLALVSLAGRVPAIWEFSLNEQGLSIGPLFGDASGEHTSLGVKKLYEWKNIQGFDIRNQTSEDYKELVLKLKARFSPYITIPFPSAQESALTARLLQFLPKEEYTESLADTLSKLIRF